jgi:hypothetical protein
MNNALWLSISLPTWFFTCLFAPLSAGALTAVPALGAVCLFAGLMRAIILRETHVWPFLFSPLASQLFVAAAGFLRGGLKGTPGDIVGYAFLALQLALIGWLIYRLKGARLSASLFGIFGATYALFAAFIAKMSFNDTWL